MEPMVERIEGKIANVNSDREVIVNRGSADGVSVGMIFRVKGVPVDVLDPDSDEVLGQVSAVKTVVKVVEANDRFSIARTYRNRRVNVGGNMSGLGNVFQPPKYKTRVETFRRDPRSGEPIAEADSLVQVGDLVESLLDGEEPDQASIALWR